MGDLFDLISANMATIRRRELVSSMVFGCSLIFTYPSYGQSILRSIPLDRTETSTSLIVRTVPRQHLGSGPVDMNNLPTDILNCEVCRQRLGLPPLNVLANSATSTTNSFVLPKPPVLPKEPAIDSEGERLELQQAAKINALSLECQAFEKQILTLSNQMEQFQSDGKKRMEQSDAVHKEILAMLEKRTESDKNGGKKKQPNKGKKPPKPIEIQ